MAKKPEISDSKPTNEKSVKNEQAENALPDGFAPLNAQPVVGWWRAAQGAKIQGAFLGKFQGPGKRGQIRHFYQIRLTKRCAIQVREGDDNSGDWIEGMGEIGDIVGVDCKPGLRDLDGLLDSDSGSQEVCIVCRNKVSLKSGNTMWTFDVGHREVPF